MIENSLDARLGTLRRIVRRAEAGDSERGSVTVFLAISAVGLLVLVGLITDGGAKLRAAQRADQVAAEAARAGGQAIDQAAVVAGGTARVDRAAAIASASAYLDAAGYEGTATPSPDGTSVDVTVTVTSPTIFLSLIGITSLTTTGHARAALVHAVTGGGP